MDDSLNDNAKIAGIEDAEKNEIQDKKVKWTKDRIFLAVIFTFVILFTIGLYIALIIDKTILFDLVFYYFIWPIHNLHVALQVLIFMGFMVLQCIVAPISSELILTSAGLLFGWWGIPVGVVGSMVSSTISYYIAKRGGRTLVDASSEKVKIIDRSMRIFDAWIDKWGLWAILVGRAIPFVAFDNISYAAGLAKIRDRQYHLSTFIGSIPRATFFTFMGTIMLGNTSINDLYSNPELFANTATQFNTIFFVLFGAAVFMFALSNIVYYVLEKQKQKKQAITTENSTLHDESLTTESEIEFSVSVDEDGSKTAKVVDSEKISDPIEASS